MRAQECEIVDESKHVSALRLLVHSFGRVDEGILSCLQGECGSVFDGPSLCSRTSREQIQQLLRDTATIDSDLWRNLKDRSPVPATSTFRAALETVGLSIDVSLSENEHADVLLTCYWVQMRLWNIALTHGYLSPMSSAVEAATPELSFQYAVDLATRTTDLFKRFSIRSWESHGEGVVSMLTGFRPYLSKRQCSDSYRLDFRQRNVLGLPPVSWSPLHRSVCRISHGHRHLHRTLVTTLVRNRTMPRMIAFGRLLDAGWTRNICSR